MFVLLTASPTLDHYGFHSTTHAVHAAQTSDDNPAPTPDQNNSTFNRIFGSPPETAHTQVSWITRTIKAFISFSLAAILAAALAFRPRKNLPIFQRNPFVAQTQILLAVVGAALMIVVADSAARAFGIFAAASLIRFRTNIRYPKEITVLLVSLAVGLASGIGKWEIALTLPPLNAQSGVLVGDSRFTRFPIGNHPRSECPSLFYVKCGVVVTMHH